MVIQICVVVCHTLYQLVLIVAAELESIEWAVNQTLILQKKVTAGWNCSEEEFSQFYDLKQKIWVEDLFKSHSNSEKVLRYDWQRGKKTEGRIQMAESGEGKDSESCGESHKKIAGSVDGDGDVSDSVVQRLYLDQVQVGLLPKMPHLQTDYISQVKLYRSGNTYEPIWRRFLEVTARND